MTLFVATIHYCSHGPWNTPDSLLKSIHSSQFHLDSTTESCKRSSSAPARIFKQGIDARGMRVACIRLRFRPWLLVLAFMPILNLPLPAEPESSPTVTLSRPRSTSRKAPLSIPGTNDTAHFEKMTAMAHLARQVAQARANLPHGGAGRSFHHQIS